MLQREPDLAGVGCVEAAGGVGAATASKELGLVGKLKIVSMDRDDGTLKFIEDGVIDASVAQKSALMTFYGTILMDGLKYNPVPIVADNKAAGIVPMPEAVDTGVVVINKDNAKYFYHTENPYDFSKIEITPPAPDETYVEVLALTNLPYFIDHRLGLEFAGEELGVKTKFVGPVDYDMTAMVNTLEQTIAEKPAGILVVGFDPALKPSIDKAAEAGIPIVTLDAEVYGSKRLTFLGTGNYNAGKVGGKFLADLVGGKGKVALLTKVGQSNLEERIAGLQGSLRRRIPRHRARPDHRRPERFGQGRRRPEGRARSATRPGRRRLCGSRRWCGRGDCGQGAGPGRQAQDRLHGPRRRHAEVHRRRRHRRLDRAEDRADELPGHQVHVPDEPWPGAGGGRQQGRGHQPHAGVR